MKKKNAVLEYCVTNSPGQARWSFRFKSKQGRVLMNSGERYASLDEAVSGFITLVKSIASNQYRIKDSCKLSKADPQE